MVRKLALILALVAVGILIWTVLAGGQNITVAINGEEITGPLGAIAGLWGLIVAAVIMFCVAIFLAFVFAGVGLIILGVFVLIGVVLAAVAFPFLLPLLIPLLLVWILCCVARRRKGV